MVKAPEDMSRTKERALGRGFLAGIFWGGLVGLGLLVVSSQVVERQQGSLPKPEAVPVEVPAGTEFDQARPETEPVAPSVETRPASEALSGVTPPEDLVETPPAFDTSSLEVPSPTVDAPGALGDVPEVAEGVEVDVTGPGPSGDVNPVQGALTVPDAPVEAPETATEAPAPAAEVEVETEDRAPEVVVTAPTQDQIDVAPAQPVIEAEPDAPTMETTSEAPSSGDAPEAMTAPEVDADSAPEPAPVVAEDTGPSMMQPVEELENQAAEVETNRLPRIGDAPVAEAAPEPEATPEPEVTPEPDVVAQAEPEEAPSLPVVRRFGASADEEAQSDAEETVEAAPAPGADGPALEAFRMPFDNASGAPVISVILRHEGADVPDAGVLQTLPEEITFAVDAGQPGAAEIAAAYRGAGREVVMIPALPDGATPQDVEVAMRANLSSVPEAVAVMDMEGGNFRTDRPAVAQVIEIAQASGHGLITFPRGLNPAHQIAEREGVPAGLIFRNMDGEGEDAGEISRTLDRAAFRARQSDAVILVGSTRPDTISTLIEWALNNRGESVRLAPVSAALLGG